MRRRGLPSRLESEMSSRRPIVEDVIHRLAEAALLQSLGTHAGSLPAVGSVGGLFRIALLDDADPQEAGSFEEGIRLAHRGKRLDPVHGAE